MSTVRPPNRTDPSQNTDDSLDDDEPRDTVTTMIDTAHAVATRLELQFKELYDVLGPVLPLNAEAMTQPDEEPPPGPKAVRQLHHLCDRLNVMSRALHILVRDAAV
ncbi:hypothetical protein K6W12_24915 [Burkholderia multivorans]|uniref:hypothetical protein n=1 Tax=Burkholderia multivorans TaxID=87883 RepID=UPI001C985C33|nr:hypothetical protein [Burkholderia multivorans]MBY4673878.1 hypothetical protein [Burkholderia multivorans]